MLASLLSEIAGLGRCSMSPARLSGAFAPGILSIGSQGICLREEIPLVPWTASIQRQHCSVPLYLI
jgi:hypothetical protein